MRQSVNPRRAARPRARFAAMLLALALCSTLSAAPVSADVTSSSAAVGGLSSTFEISDGFKSTRPCSTPSSAGFSETRQGPGFTDMYNEQERVWKAYLSGNSTLVLCGKVRGTACGPLHGYEGKGHYTSSDTTMWHEIHDLVWENRYTKTKPGTFWANGYTTVPSIHMNGRYRFYRNGVLSGTGTIIVEVLVHPLDWYLGRYLEWHSSVCGEEWPYNYNNYMRVASHSATLISDAPSP